VQTAEKKKANVQRRREVEKRVAKYLVDCRRINGWGREDVGIALMLFEETHGADAVAAMGRFIDWAEKNDRTDMIPVTLGHDLNGCEDKFMSPRTSGY